MPSLVKAASGVVLELGPGSGNQLHRFDMSRVSYIYGKTIQSVASFLSTYFLYHLNPISLGCEKGLTLDCR